MPNPNNRSDRDFSQYDAMDDAQLQEILRKDASNSQGEDTDMELMLHIMEVLAKRRKAINKDISPESALESFKQNYLFNDDSLVFEERPVQPKKSVGRWRRWFATVAAVLVLVFCGSLTAQAFGFDIFEIIAKWTQETFHLGSASQVDSNAPDVKDNTPYLELQDTLERHNIQVKLAPTVIPSGYKTVDIKSIDTPKQRQFIAILQNGEDIIKIVIVDYLESSPSQIEQSDSLEEIYVVDGIEYHIVQDNDLLQAVWINNNYECYISGPLSLSEIKIMINSIGKG